MHVCMRVCVCVCGLELGIYVCVALCVAEVLFKSTTLHYKFLEVVAESGSGFVVVEIKLA